MPPEPLLARALAAEEPPGDETTERILDAALAQFATFGLRRSSVEEVARRAGLGRMTIYRRFPRKDRLVEAVILREARRFTAELDAAVMPLPAVEERMVEGFVVALRSVRRHPLLGRLLALEPEALLPYLTVHAGPALGIARGFLAERIRQARAEGAIPELDPDRAADVVVRLVLSFVLTPDESLDDERAARAFARRYIAPIVTRA